MSGSQQGRPTTSPARLAGHAPPASAGRGFAARHAAACEAGREAETSADAAAMRPPIDHVHLARYTLGDRALELEVLGLFAGEAPNTLVRIRAAAASSPFDHKAWVAACHTLKGSARAVGAFAVAAAAEQAEREADRHPALLATHAEQVAAALAEVLDYIATLHAKA